MLKFEPSSKSNLYLESNGPYETDFFRISTSSSMSFPSNKRSL